VSHADGGLVFSVGDVLDNPLIGSALRGPFALAVLIVVPGEENGASLGDVGRVFVLAPEIVPVVPFPAVSPDRMVVDRASIVHQPPLGTLLVLRKADVEFQQVGFLRVLAFLLALSVRNKLRTEGDSVTRPLNFFFFGGPRDFDRYQEGVPLVVSDGQNDALFWAVVLVHVHHHSGEWLVNLAFLLVELQGEDRIAVCF